MAPQKSSHLPTKGTSTSHHTAMPQASWMDGDTDTLLDLVITHKALAGEGMNFKAIFWNTVSATLANPTKGGPKTAKVCMEKWKRLRKMFDVVDHIANTSGFAYSLQSGANISLENEAMWNEFTKKYKNVSPFCNKGWLHYKKMKQLMPSKGKGLNCFLALSLSKSHSTGGNRLSASTSKSEHGEGSTSTVVECSNNGQSTLCTGTNDIEMSYPLIEPFIPSAAKPACTFCVPATHMQAIFNWQSDQSAGPPTTLTNFTPPTAPSLFSGLAISSIKLSSSVSACIECLRKWKADGKDSSLISSSLSVLKTSTSSAQK
ncbi:hypothetical protein V8B97DRAFT_1965628 [Scleroderma yunnanense]